MAKVKWRMAKEKRRKGEIRILPPPILILHSKFFLMHFSIVADPLKQFCKYFIRRVI